MSALAHRLKATSHPLSVRRCLVMTHAHADGAVHLAGLSYYAFNRGLSRWCSALLSCYPYSWMQLLPALPYHYHSAAAMCTTMATTNERSLCSWRADTNTLSCKTRSRMEGLRGTIRHERHRCHQVLRHPSEGGPSRAVDEEERTAVFEVRKECCYRCCWLNACAKTLIVARTKSLGTLAYEDRLALGRFRKLWEKEQIPLIGKQDLQRQVSQRIYNTDCFATISPHRTSFFIVILIFPYPPTVPFRSHKQLAAASCSLSIGYSKLFLPSAIYWTIPTIDNKSSGSSGFHNIITHTNFTKHESWMIYSITPSIVLPLTTKCCRNLCSIDWATFSQRSCAIGWV